MAKHIALVGMMGAGKSSVAPLVGAALKRPVFEVDGMIEKAEGLPISEIFIAKGEAYFRRLECVAIQKLIGQPPAVLSLGGGAFMWDATRELLLAQTIVFYLSATLEVLSSRLSSTTSSRPLLNTPGIDLTSTLAEILERRTSAYEQAHYRVQTDFHSPQEVAESVLIMREAYE